MSDYVRYDDEVFEYRDVGFWTTHTARTEKRCNECSQPIAVGQRYEKLSYVFEGDWQTVYQHLRGQCPYVDDDDYLPF